jgi:hypothetical protein
MKFPGIEPGSSSKSSLAPDITAQVMERLGFDGLDGTSASMQKARKKHLLRRTGAFFALVSLILIAAIVERHFSKDGILETAAMADESGDRNLSRVNAFSALQAPFQRINSSLSATEAVEAPSYGASNDDEVEDLAPLQGPILVPGAFGNASASLTSS